MKSIQRLQLSAGLFARDWIPMGLFIALWFGLAPGNIENLMHPNISMAFLHSVRSILPFAAATVGTILILSTIRNTKRTYSMFIGPLGFLFAYGVVGIGASLVSADKSDSLYWASSYAAVPIVLWAICYSPNTLRRIQDICDITWLFALFGLVLLLAYAFTELDMHNALLNPTILERCNFSGVWHQSLGSGLIRSTAVGRYAAIAGLVAIAGIAHGRWKLIWSIALIGALLILFSTGARTSFVAFTGAAAIMVFVYWGRKAVASALLIVAILTPILLVTGLPNTLIQWCFTRHFEIRSAIPEPSDSHQPAYITSTETDPILNQAPNSIAKVEPTPTHVESPSSISSGETAVTLTAASDSITKAKSPLNPSANPSSTAKAEPASTTVASSNYTSKAESALNPSANPSSTVKAEPASTTVASSNYTSKAESALTPVGDPSSIGKAGPASTPVADLNSTGRVTSTSHSNNISATNPLADKPIQYSKNPSVSATSPGSANAPSEINQDALEKDESKKFVNFSGRVDVWRAGLSFFKQSPIVGHGFNADRIEFNTHMHNSFVHSLVQTGIVGTLFLGIGIIMAWVLFFKGARNLFRFSAPQRTRIVLAGGMLGFFTIRSIAESSGAFFGVDLLILAPALLYLSIVTKSNEENV